MILSGCLWSERVAEAWKKMFKHESDTGGTCGFKFWQKLKKQRFVDQTIYWRNNEDERIVVEIIPRCESLAVAYSVVYREEGIFVANKLTRVNNILAFLSIEVGDIDDRAALDAYTSVALPWIDDNMIGVSGEFCFILEQRGISGLRFRRW